MKNRVVKYAGFSRVVNEKGETSYNFHTSNNTKYAVWAQLPEKELADGHQVTFHWFKMPANTEKLDAVRKLLAHTAVNKSDAVVAMLNGVLTKSEPKVKVAKVRKVKAPKPAKVHVTVTEPKLESKGAKAIREAVEKRKAAAA